MIDLDRIERLARNATPGIRTIETITLGPVDTYFEVAVGRRTIVQTHVRENKREAVLLERDAANVGLIAALSPDVVLALIEMARRASPAGIVERAATADQLRG